jgi:glycerol-1-phosphate dehydrogenase [NAD(P)+]
VTPEVVIADDAIERLSAAAPERVLVVMDANTREAAGERVAAMLGDPPTVVFEAGHGLHPDWPEVARVRAGLGSGVTPVAVGAGVITDIVRYASHDAGQDFISVPTAASMDGYSSSMAAMQINGVKLTFPARAPIAIYADPQVLGAAPTELTRAGIGDLLGKTTAGVDWLAAHLLYGERYDSAVAADMRRAMLLTAENVPALMAGDPAAMRDLIDGLIQSGNAIASFGNSRPASGLEHHASHFWDLLAARGLRDHGSHGLQVGYATASGMRLQRHAYAVTFSDLHRPLPALDPLGPVAREWLGAPTEEIVQAVACKQEFIADSTTWPADSPAWDDVREALADAMQPFEAVEVALVQAEIPDRPGFVGVDRRMLIATCHHATRLRDRYTTIDFLESQRRLDEAITIAIL